MRDTMFLEIATAPAHERARLFDSPSQRLQVTGLMAKEIRQIKAGGRICDNCKHRAGTVATGDPRALRALCRDCSTQEKLDRRVEINRGARAAMKSRG